MQRDPVDAEDFGGARLVAAALVEHAQNVIAFHVVQVADIAYSKPAPFLLLSEKSCSRVRVPGLRPWPARRNSPTRVRCLGSCTAAVRSCGGETRVNPLAHLARELAGEVVYQQRNIFAAFAASGGISM